MDCCLWARACQCSATISTINSVSTPSQVFFFVRASKLVENVFVFNTLRGNQHHLTPEDATIGRHLYFHWALFIDGFCILMLLLLNRFPLFPSLGPVLYLPHYCENCEIVRMCEWTSTSGQVTKRALRVSGRNRKAPLAVFSSNLDALVHTIHNTPIAERKLSGAQSSFVVATQTPKFSIDRNYFDFIHLQGLFSDLGLRFERDAKVFKKYPQFELVPAAEGASFLHFQVMKSGVLNLRPKPKITVFFPLINNAQLEPWLVTIGTSLWKKKILISFLYHLPKKRRLAIEGLDAPLLSVGIPRLDSVLPRL